MPSARLVAALAVCAITRRVWLLFQAEQLWI